MKATADIEKLVREKVAQISDADLQKEILVHVKIQAYYQKESYLLLKKHLPVFTLLAWVILIGIAASIAMLVNGNM